MLPFGSAEPVRFPIQCYGGNIWQVSLESALQVPPTLLNAHAYVIRSCVPEGKKFYRNLKFLRSLHREHIGLAYTGRILHFSDDFHSPPSSERSNSVPETPFCL